MSNNALKSFKSWGRRKKRSIASFTLLENEAEARIGDPHCPLHSETHLIPQIHTVWIAHSKFCINEIQFIGKHGECSTGPIYDGRVWNSFKVDAGESIIGMFGETLIKDKITYR